MALLRDPEFFAYLEEHAERLAGGDLDILERVVRVSAGHHIDHIGSSGDPFERGSGRPLDFGHWSAHCLESLSGYRLRHGEAVAVGIAIDTVYAAKAGLLAEDDAERILALIDALGLPTHDDTLSITSGNGLAVLSGLEEFREHLGGELQITLLEGIGRSVEVFDVDERLVIEAIGCLRARPRAAVAGPQAVAAARAHEGRRIVPPRLLLQHPSW